jgi:hypothetical protein
MGVLSMLPAERLINEPLTEIKQVKGTSETTLELP